MRLLATSALLLAFLGCDSTSNNPARPGTSTTPSSSSSTSPEKSRVDNTRPDNTGVNERDRDPNAKTPVQQNENKRDVQITADIRKAILATDGMSINARNSKIITADGKVTLRGPVASADEKTKIEKIAEDVAGEGDVTNELEVTDSK